ncbi:hypothetical protein [Bacteroides ihuae]|uniref:hypothetical protein n=1 Tax=Bacteroides ihuae TaxID=1852362 RepID=UPI00135666E1|nr:hypothetical protein [Bacteroides ihuae]
MRSIKRFLSGAFFLHAQNGSFKGRVLFSDGHPTEYVSVIVQGTEKDTTTNRDRE